MIIFPNTERSAASKISERIRKSIEEYSFVDGLRVTISGGVGQYRDETLTELVHTADTGLYKAKRSGKNRVISV